MTINDHPGTDDEKTYPDYFRRSQPPTPPEMTDPCEHLLDFITNSPSRIDANNPGLLQTQVPTFRGRMDNSNEFEHLLHNHLRLMSHKLPEEAKVQYLQSLLREEAFEFHHSVTITTEANLNVVLTKFRKNSTKDDLEEVASHNWDQNKKRIPQQTKFQTSQSA